MTKMIEIKNLAHREVPSNPESVSVALSKKLSSAIESLIPAGSPSQILEEQSDKEELRQNFIAQIAELNSEFIAKSRVLQSKPVLQEYQEETQPFFQEFAITDYQSALDQAERINQYLFTYQGQKKLAGFSSAIFFLKMGYKRELAAQAQVAIEENEQIYEVETAVHSAFDELLKQVDYDFTAQTLDGKVVSARQNPDGFKEIMTKAEVVRVGDSHANLVKVFGHLLSANIIEMQPEDVENFIKYYEELGDLMPHGGVGVTKRDENKRQLLWKARLASFKTDQVQDNVKMLIKKLEDLIDKMVVNDVDCVIHFLGDMLGDRGLYDLLMLKLLKKVDPENKKLLRFLSSHDLQAFSNALNGEKYTENYTQSQYSSYYNSAEIDLENTKKGIVEYMKSCQLMHYDKQTGILEMHAPVSQKLMQELIGKLAGLKLLTENDKLPDPENSVWKHRLNKLFNRINYKPECIVRAANLFYKKCLEDSIKSGELNENLAKGGILHNFVWAKRSQSTHSYNNPKHIPLYGQVNYVVHGHDSDIIPGQDIAHLGNKGSENFETKIVDLNNRAGQFPNIKRSKTYPAPMLVVAEGLAGQAGEIKTPENIVNQYSLEQMSKMLNLFKRQLVQNSEALNLRVPDLENPNKWIKKSIYSGVSFDEEENSFDFLYFTQINSSKNGAVVGRSVVIDSQNYLDFCYNNFEFLKGVIKSTQNFEIALTSKTNVVFRTEKLFVKPDQKIENLNLDHGTIIRGLDVGLIVESGTTARRLTTEQLLLENPKFRDRLLIGQKITLINSRGEPEEYIIERFEPETNSFVVLQPDWYDNNLSKQKRLTLEDILAYNPDLLTSEEFVKANPGMLGNFGQISKDGKSIKPLKSQEYQSIEEFILHNKEKIFGKANVTEITRKEIQNYEFSKCKADTTEYILRIGKHKIAVVIPNPTILNFSIDHNRVFQKLEKIYAKLPDSVVKHAHKIIIDPDRYRKGGALGSYKNGAITFYLGEKYLNPAVAYHEIAHAMASSLTDNEEYLVPKNWGMAKHNDKNAVSLYGETNHAEDFAEFAMKYFLALGNSTDLSVSSQLNDLKNKHPNRFKVFLEVLDKLKSI